MKEDIRWIQRYNNFVKAFTQLENAVRFSEEKKLTILEKQGVVLSFEFTHELAWNVIKAYFYFHGRPTVNDSRDAAREAFGRGLISDRDIWIKMIKSRNQIYNAYDEKVVKQIFRKIIRHYFYAFAEFNETMNIIKETEVYL